MPDPTHGFRRAQRPSSSSWIGANVFRPWAFYIGWHLALALPYTGPSHAAGPKSERHGGWGGAVEEGFQVPEVRQGRTATTAKERDTMKRFFASILSVAVFVAFIPVTEAAPCPPEVAQAKDLLSKKTSKVQEIQAPRSLAGARGQEQQAPRGQEAQAPRGQEKQAPRGQEMQAPRGQETQAPRGQETQAPRSLAGSKIGSGKPSRS